MGDGIGGGGKILERAGDRGVEGSGYNEVVVCGFKGSLVWFPVGNGKD